jgi:hypothetical protein
MLRGPAWAGFVVVDGSRLDLLKDAQLLGASLSIEKPFTGLELLQVVNQALRAA